MTQDFRGRLGAGVRAPKLLLRCGAVHQAAVNQPLLILSDAHISRDYGQTCGDQLAALVRQHPDCELVLAGDIFDLSLDAADTCPQQSLEQALHPHQRLLDSLRDHVRGGSKVTLVPGNHDASISHDRIERTLRQRLHVPQDESLEVCAWFARRGDLHIEHGHLYDPDCAPNHPLSDPNPRSEGLGNALMRRFVSPNDALIFAHAHQTTPVSGLKTAFEKWGVRAPVVIYNYFQTAFSLCTEALTRAPLVRCDTAQGQARLADYSARAGVNEDVLAQLLELAPRPTHHSMEAMFFRLYFDRIFAGCAVATGLMALSAAGLSVAAGSLSTAGPLTGTGSLLAALGSGYLLHSLRDKNRYAANVVERLGVASAGIRAATNSKLVVLGHSHVEVDEPGYVNLGSFGFPQGSGRPYLLVNRNGHAERKRWL
jgi:UDP-2,3-diacylglucosamine pyrophosphatase LpxH